MSDWTKGQESLTTVADQFTKRIAEMQLLALPDMDTLTTAHRRNLEALAAAYRASLEGAQELARRNSEIVRQAMDEMTEAVRAGGCPVAC